MDQQKSDWSDPNHDVIGDLRRAKQQAFLSYSRQTGKTIMQERFLEEQEQQIEEAKKEKTSLKEKLARLRKGPDNYSIGILQGLQSKPLYQGTYNGNKQKRRVKNKVAKASRRKNRR